MNDELFHIDDIVRIVYRYVAATEDLIGRIDYIGDEYFTIDSSEENRSKITKIFYQKDGILIDKIIEHIDTGGDF